MMREIHDGEQINVEQIERMAARAWPAETAEVLDGWLLRATNGTKARRANSVLPISQTEWVAWDAQDDLDARLDACRLFYEERRIPLRFQISPAASPRHLDVELERRGFHKEAVTDVMVAPCERVVTLLRDTVSPFTVEIECGWSQRWFGNLIHISAYGADEPEALRRLLQRIPGQRYFACAKRDNKIVAIGLAVAEDAWAGLFCFATDPQFLRLGACSTVLKALAGTCLDFSVTRLYLQVMVGNIPAQRLYRKAGFQLGYRYHFRLR